MNKYFSNLSREDYKAETENPVIVRLTVDSPKNEDEFAAFLDITEDGRAVLSINNHPADLVVVDLAAIVRDELHKVDGWEDTDTLTVAEMNALAGLLAELA